MFPRKFFFLLFFVAAGLLVSIASFSVWAQLTSDLKADVVLGQPDFAQAIPGEIVSFKTAGPGGVTVDRSTRPNRVYVFDGMNSRILGYSSLGVCANDSAKACTTDSDCSESTCNVQVGGETGQKKADLVLGQPGFNTSACNGDGTGLSYPNTATASASSLCSMPPNVVSPYEYGSFASMVTDADGNLYTADPFNHRVLKYNSPFTTDTVADEVWGQSDFSGNKPNKGLSQPDATSLSLINSSPQQTLTIGIDLDPAGNLWVTDPNNNRVLRYPKGQDGTIAKTADLVLGQPDFMSRNSGNSLSQFYNPSGVGVHPDGRVFVTDTENNRVLVFSAPFTNGQAGVQFGTGFKSPNGVNFETNPANTSLPVGIWIQDSRNSQLVMFDNDANPIKVLNKNTYSNDGSCNYVCEARGSIGITSDGDIIAAASTNAQDAFFFKHPIPLIGAGTYYAQARFYNPPDGHNYLSNKGFSSARGITVANNQVIAVDQKRILYWNIPNGVTDLANGKPADGVAGVDSFTTFADIDYSRLDSDSVNGLWVAHQPRLEHYTLPLTMGEQPDAVINTRDFRILGQNTSIGQDFEISGIAVDPQGKFVWVAVANKDRVFRLRVPSSLNGTYIIDAIIGGTTIPSYSHSWGDTCDATVQNYPNALCFPGSVSLDKAGNVFISDLGLEFFGDRYVFRFDKSKFPTNNSSLLVYYQGDAAQKFSNVGAWQAAFSSQNKMVLGFAAHIGSPYQGRVGIVDNIYSTSTLSFDQNHLLTDHYAQAYAMDFDANDNLLVADLNWGRILVYQQPFGPPSNNTPTPSITITSTPTRTPTLTPTPTRIITNTPTPTPTKSLVPPSNVSAKGTSKTQIQLSWTDTNTNETGYAIERSQSPSIGFTQIAVVGTNKTAYVNTGLKQATTYFYRLRATGANNTYSTYSATVMAATSIR